jgi:TolB-like protein/Tfp pilus assembly protein PilF
VEIFKKTVWQALGLYAAGSWLVLQIVDILADNVGLPSWGFTLALVLLIVGLPIVTLTAYFHGPGRRPEPGESEVAETARSLFTWRNAVLGGVGASALWGVVAAVWMLTGGGGPKAAAEASSAGGRSIAVLPLATRVAGDGASGDEVVIFADGMHGDLLTQLSRIPELRVTSRTSVEEFRDASRNLREIAERLGVSFIVEGSVDRVGDRIRVNVQLIDAETDRHLWASTYDETMTLDNLFAIRDDLTRRVAGALQATLSPEVEAQIAERPTEDVEAFKLYTRGRHLWARGSRDDVEQAIELLERAAERDPNFALAHAALAHAHLRMSDYGYAPEARTLPAAAAAADRALRLDPRLADALAARAMVDWRRGNLIAAREGLERALGLNPSHSAAHSALGSLYIDLGYEDRAVDHLRLAHDLDPLAPDIGNSLALALGYTGRVSEAMAQASRTVELHPDFEPAITGLAYGLHYTGRTEEALEVMRQALQRDPGSIWANENLAWILMHAGRTDAALAQAERAVELTPDDVPTHLTRAELLSKAGRFDEGVESAHEAVRLDPRAAWTRRELADRLLEVGDTTGAVAQLDTLVALPGRVSFEAADLLFEAGKVEAAVRLAREIAEREPESVYARARLARLLFLTAPWSEHSPEEALAVFREALDLSPVDADALVYYGRTLRELGRTRESLAPVERVAADRPGLAGYREALGWEQLVGQRTPEEAGAEFRRALEIGPGQKDFYDTWNESALWGLARVHASAARWDSAYAVQGRTIESCSGERCRLSMRARLAWLHALAGDDDRARSLVRELEAMRDHPDWASWLPVFAAVYGELGDLDAAFEYLERGYERRAPLMLELKIEPWFDPLRQDSRYDAMLRRLKLD